MTDPIARTIVSQLGDLYMDFTHPATSDRAEFVKYRQATNDQADVFVEALLHEYGATVLQQAADDWQRGEWANAPRRADRVQERIANGQHVGDWLRARAARPPATAKGPTPPAHPLTYHEALAACGGLLNAPAGDGCDHLWRTYADAQGPYGCCVRCAQRCLACVRGLDAHGPGRVMVCTVCGTGHGVEKAPRA
ncbi:hypothetical protein [Promicromonospora sp. NPDC023805]|uniref:hypothetical protein n=1 Tax=Promicromonospora sp. NPDC023805 TaxID=3154696 RepID=UPI0033DA3019